MMVVQQALRPYATAGIALVGASMIAVAPTVAPPPSVQVRPVKLVDAWSDLLTDTTANFQNILSGEDSSAISGVLSALLTNPLGVIDALTNLDPTVTTDPTLPVTIGVELPPSLELGIAGLGAYGATLDAINGVVAQLSSDPSNALSTLYEGSATILNALLNGADNVSLLGGIIDIPLFNGILAPEQSATLDINLADLVNALGLGNLSLSNVDLSSLLGQIGLGDLTVGSLFSDLGLSTDTLGDLLGNPTLGTVLSDLGLGDFGLGSLNLTTLLGDLGLDTNVDLSSLTVADVLGDFGINPTLSQLSNLSLSSILESFGVDVPSGSTLGGTTLTNLLSDLGLGSTTLTTLLENAATDLGGTIKTLVDDLLLLPGVETITNQLNLGELLSGLTLGGSSGSLSLDTLLGDLGINLPSSLDLQDTSIAEVLSNLGISVPGNLSIATILGDLGFSGATGSLTLGGLLGDLGGLGNTILDTPVGSLLDVDLGTLLTDLGISGDALNLGDLGDLSNLNLGELLGDLGTGDLASVNVDTFGGLITELVDTVPQQILAAI
jgi:hypothetical protein